MSSLEECKEHKWMLLENGWYECQNCKTVVTAQQLRTIQSVKKALKGTEYEKTIPKTVICKKKPKSKQKILEHKMKIPLGSTIDFENQKIDIFNIDFSKILNIELRYVDEDEFLLLVIKEGEAAP